MLEDLLARWYWTWHTNASNKMDHCTCMWVKWTMYVGHQIGNSLIWKSGHWSHEANDRLRDQQHIAQVQRFTCLDVTSCWCTIQLEILGTHVGLLMYWSRRSGVRWWWGQGWGECGVDRYMNYHCVYMQSGTLAVVGIIDCTIGSFVRPSSPTTANLILYSQLSLYIRALS